MWLSLDVTMCSVCLPVRERVNVRLCETTPLVKSKSKSKSRQNIIWTLGRVFVSTWKVVESKKETRSPKNRFCSSDLETPKRWKVPILNPTLSLERLLRLEEFQSQRFSKHFPKGKTLWLVPIGDGNPYPPSLLSQKFDGGWKVLIFFSGKEPTLND